MKKLIFGFLPPSEEQPEPTFLVSFKEDFQRDRCVNDTYPDEVNRMFREWEKFDIYEVMESQFEYPAGRQHMVKNYLEHFYNMEYDSGFQVFLLDIWDEENGEE